MGNYLRCIDFVNGDRKFTIGRWAYKTFEYDGENEEKFVLYSDNRWQGWVVNGKSMATLKMMFGSDPNEWIGKTVVLYIEPLTIRGQTIKAIRVRNNQ